MKRGCKFRKPRIKEVYTTKVVAYIIDKFNGEFI
jgi:hypothetical protein